VQSAIHVGLGARGLVTNGSVRDIDQWAPGFQFLAGSIGPSHAYAKPVGFGDEVHRVRTARSTGRHSARRPPWCPSSCRRASCAPFPAAAREIAAREARILKSLRAPGCTSEKARRGIRSTRRHPLTRASRGFVRYHCPPGRRFSTDTRAHDSRRETHDTAGTH
jgi:hypothetical protein